MEVELDSLDVQYDRKKSESFFFQWLRIDLMDQVWSGEGKELNFGQATFNIQIERSSRLLDL